MNYETLSVPLPVDFPAEWFHCDSGHFWFSWRARVLQQLLIDHALPIQDPQRVLDVGCGVGLLKKQLADMTQWTIDGADVNASALKQSTDARGRTLLYNIEDRHPTFNASYDGIVLFDVLEHISDPAAFLAAALWHLKPTGWVLINVPALQTLYSRYDELVGHFRRYNKTSLQELIAPQLQIAECRYWGISLVAAAWLRQFTLSKRDRPRHAIEKGFRVPAAWMNALLTGVFRFETSVWPKPWIGSSLMVLARKPPLR